MRNKRIICCLNRSIIRIKILNLCENSSSSSKHVPDFETVASSLVRGYARITTVRLSHVITATFFPTQRNHMRIDYWIRLVKNALIDNNNGHAV